MTSSPPRYPVMSSLHSACIEALPNSEESSILKEVILNRILAAEFNGLMCDRVKIVIQDLPMGLSAY